MKPKEHMEMKGRLYLNLGLVMDEQNLPDRAVDYLNKVCVFSYLVILVVSV